MNRFISRIVGYFGYKLIEKNSEEVPSPVLSQDTILDASTSPDWSKFADGDILEKGRSFQERARDVISDPLNLLIDRVPNAGYVDRKGRVILHNGNRVPASGDFSYYGEFSEVLISNRGVHEPLEEFCFQQVLKKIHSTKPRMVELGAYWAHYSMWLKLVYPDADCTMVEPEEQNLEAGKKNFEINGYDGEFIQAFVAKGQFSVDTFMEEKQVDRLDILHCDIQGYEKDMLQEASETLANHKADYVFISTHSEQLHNTVLNQMKGFGYRIEAHSPFEKHTTSFDGFVLASSPNLPELFSDFEPWGREDIAKATGRELLEKLNLDAASISVTQ